MIFSIKNLQLQYRKSRIFHVKNILFRVKTFLDKQPRTALALTIHIIFRVFNFRIAHAVRKYFNNENFAIYESFDMTYDCIPLFNSCLFDYDWHIDHLLFLHNLLDLSWLYLLDVVSRYETLLTILTSIAMEREGRERERDQRVLTFKE